MPVLEGFRNHDDPGLCVDRLLRAATLQRTTRKRRWPGYAIAFICGALVTAAGMSL